MIRNAIASLAVSDVSAAAEWYERFNDLDGEVSRLHRAGFATGDPTRTETVAVMMIKDPDGNSIALAETSDSARTR